MDGVKRKILYVTYDGLTDALGQSQILSYLSELSHLDNEFYILSFEKKQNFDKNKAIVEAKVVKNNIHWIKKWYTKKPPVLSTLHDIYQARKEAKKLHQQIGFDLVHCRGYVPALIGLWLKRKFGLKFIFDMRGWWPDEKLESGSWSSPVFKPIYEYFKQKEKDFFQSADYTVSLTEEGRRKIVNSFRVHQKRIGVVPTCVNFQVFKECSLPKRVSVRKALQIPESAKVLVYSGALGGNYDLSLLKSIFKKFTSKYSNSYILILSKDVLSPAFKEELATAGITNYQLKNVSYTEVSDHLCAADLGLIFYKPAFSNIGRSPTKLGEYWASGVPVMATDGIGDLNLLQQKYPGGIITVNLQLTDMDEKLEQIELEQRKELREYAKAYCSLEKGVQFYQSLYQQLI